MGRLCKLPFFAQSFLAGELALFPGPPLGQKQAGEGFSLTRRRENSERALFGYSGAPMYGRHFLFWMVHCATALRPGRYNSGDFLFPSFFKRKFHFSSAFAAVFLSPPPRAEKEAALLSWEHLPVFLYFCLPRREKSCMKGRSKRQICRSVGGRSLLPSKVMYAYFKDAREK